MRGKKTVSIMLDTAEDVHYKPTLADLRTFMQQAELMSDNDWPQVFLHIEEMQGPETHLVATSELL